MLRPYWILLLFMFPAAVLGQTLPVQPCASDVLNTTFQAMQGPDETYTLAINLRNGSRSACFLDNSPGGTGVDLPGGKGIQVCYYCEKDSQRPPESRIILAPGDSAYQLRSWATSSEGGGEKCVSPIDMNWSFQPSENDSSFWLYSRSLVKPICSTVVTTDYAPGQFLSGALASLPPGSRAPIIRWANNEGAPYSRERISLQVTVEDPSHVLLLDENSCPRLVVQTRDATPGRVISSRLTRVDELQGGACKVEGLGAADRRFIMEFDARYALTPKKNDENKGEFTLDVSALAEIEGRYFFVSATQPLHLSMVDGKLVRRNWGPAVQGVTVSLNLDSDVYALGSDIPLHIALENSDSQQPISAMDPYYDPPGVAVDLQDVTGQPVAVGERLPWSGHGFCHPFPKGLVFPIELKLSQMGFRLHNPGVYTLIAVWQPMLSDGCAIVMKPPLPAHLTVKSSPVTFRVVDRPFVPSQPEQPRP